MFNSPSLIKYEAEFSSFVIHVDILDDRHLKSKYNHKFQFDWEK